MKLSASRDLILAIDCGTQSLRGLLFDRRGGVTAQERVPFQSSSVLQPGWHEHDPEDFWSATCAAIHALRRGDAALLGRVAGVVVTAHPSVVNVGADGRALRPAITWLDRRRTPLVPKISARWRLAFRAARLVDTIDFVQREAEVNWIKAYEPEIWAGTHKFLFLTGYLNFRFSGRFVDSVASQVGYVPFDFKRLSWARRGDWKWEALAVKPQMLPELVQPGTVIGEITLDAATATGLPRGTPLIAAGYDKVCEVLGTGCLDPSVACISYGTGASVSTTSRRYVEVVPIIPPFPSAVPGAYNIEMLVMRGYWMVSWFKEQFGLNERLAAENEDSSPEALFERLIDEVPPGAMGLILQPYWAPGLRMPGPEAKGAVIGFGDIHTRAHFYRAIIEGLAFALREGLERIERRMRTTITTLRVAGGGSQSDAAMQVTADVFGRPAARMQVHEASALGAAIDAAIGLAWYPDFATAAGEMTRVVRVFEPRSAHRGLYDALYERVYLRMYDRLRPLYESIREITGYPADS